MSSKAMQSVEMVPVEALTGHPNNGRNMDAKEAQEGLQELAQSIMSLGVLEPVLARPMDGGTFQILAGHRRVAAAILAGLEQVPVIARAMSDAEAMEVLVTENLQREDLAPMEEAAGVAALMETAGWRAKDVADRLGKPMSWVAQRARLSHLSPWWKQKAADPKNAISKWPIGHLLLISRLEPEVQEEVGKGQYAKVGWVPDLSQIEHLVSQLTKKLTLAPWKLTDEALYPEAGACATCRKRSGCHPGLFDEDADAKNPAKNDRCLDALCWDVKWKRFRTAKEQDLRAKHPNLVLIKGDGDYSSQDGVFAHHEYEAAKKGDPNAVPALVVGGKGAGSLKWVVLERSRPAAVGGKRGKPKGADGKPTPTPLSQRRMDLERRRKAKAVELLIDRLDPEHIPELAALLKLVSVFGTHHKHDQLNGGAYSPISPANGAMNYDCKSERKCWDAYLEVTPSQANAQLWNSVAWVLKKRLTYHPQVNMAALWAEAEAVARVVRVDMDDMLAAACDAIPDPKSWAGLNEDGTPKAKAVKAKAADPDEEDDNEPPSGEYEGDGDEEAAS
jgi:ParB/RepB/Spo0J family partition protein